MLIFDGFKSKVGAEQFVEAVRRQGVGADVFDSQDESDAVDPFPFELQPPIVLVERGANDDALEVLVVAYGGVFAGT